MTTEQPEPMRLQLYGGPEDGAFVEIESTRLFTSIPVGTPLLVNGWVYEVQMDGRAHFGEGQENNDT